MPSEKEVYEKHAREYEALVSREDYQGNILKALQEIVDLKGMDVLDLGSGTGRLACLLAPHVQTMLAFDSSPHMLGIARNKMRQTNLKNWSTVSADHRLLPLMDRSADLIVSGWSVSYVSVWYPDRWRLEVEAWLTEARRVLRKEGTIILLESLGTGNESPKPPGHLENFFQWLNEKGFMNRWIRTDYKFESPEIGSEVAGFFFGEEMKRRILEEKITILPECTGVWWIKI